MIIPVRCFTCGKLIGDKWEEFKRRVDSGEDPSKILDSLGIERYCCRRMMISHVELMDELLLYRGGGERLNEKWKEALK
ncbi:MAG: DNA-directed RNA polymerase subunit N [Candidatus Bathyarchaeia archaeon]